MKVIATELAGVHIIEPTVHGDARGFFVETYHLERYRHVAGIREPFVQDNHSRSGKGVLRGLHFQVTRPQGKLVRCSLGAVYDVAVDIDPSSPTFGGHVGVVLSAENHRQLWIPPGYAHGFLVLTETADFQYKCTQLYDASDEAGVLWNDPALAIPWPLEAIEPRLSAKDRDLPTLEDYIKGIRA